MKTLVAYYSRTGVTRKAAEALAKALKADVEEIIDLKKRTGIIGYFRSARDALRKHKTEIKKIEKKPAGYDLVLIGTPIWAGTMASAIRTYLNDNKFRKVAFFCTMGGSGDEKTFQSMKELSMEPVATLTLLARDVMRGDITKKINDFTKKLRAK